MKIISLYSVFLSIFKIFPIHVTLFFNPMQLLFTFSAYSVFKHCIMYLHHDHSHSPTENIQVVSSCIFLNRLNKVKYTDNLPFKHVQFFFYFIHRAIKPSSLYNLRGFSSPKPYLVEVTSSAFIPKYLGTTELCFCELVYSVRFI